MFFRSTTLIAVLALATVAVGCRGWTSKDPPVHLNPNMDTQNKHKAFRADDSFADGRSMRTPPAGTVARTVAGDTARDALFVGEDTHLYTGVAADGTIPNALPSSLKADQAMLDRGQERYDIFCAPCHAKHGKGNGTVASRLAIKPPTFHDDTRASLPLSHYFRIITHGKPLPEDRGSPDDKLNMPSYAAQISVEDRWAIASYMRALQLLNRKELPPAQAMRLAGTEPPPADDEASDESDAEGEK
jgi:mono/diheme cytochrome c family protein